jgi:hypothetical protein
LGEISDRGLGTRVGVTIADPQRRVVARFIERLHALAIGLAFDDAVKPAGDHVV